VLLTWQKFKQHSCSVPITEFHLSHTVHAANEDGSSLGQNRLMNIEGQEVNEEVIDENAQMIQ
jgi:hypothetical protein